MLRAIITQWSRGFPNGPCPVMRLRPLRVLAAMCLCSSTSLAVDTLFLAEGGHLNGAPIGPSHYEITVSPGEALDGTIRVTLFNGQPGSSVFPVGATYTWGNRVSNPWVVAGSAPPGTRTYEVAVSLTAPQEPGTYYIMIGAAPRFNVAQVLSATSAGCTAVWFDGNDIGWDWSDTQFQRARNSGYATVSTLNCAGQYVSQERSTTWVQVTVRSTTASTVYVGQFTGPSGPVGLYGKDYRYHIGSVGSTWYSSSYDHSSWGTGETPFSNQRPMDVWPDWQWSAPATAWPTGSTIYVYKEFPLATPVPLSAQIAIDNDYWMYVNGVLVDSQVSEGFPYHWEYTVDIPASAFRSGTNSLAFQLRDRGGGAGWDFALLGPPVDDAPSLQLVGLEVTQAVQDWRNCVPLIENKTTYIRAHLEPADPATSEIAATARLRGWRNGSELPGSPLPALNPGVVVRQNAADRRGSWNSTLNFRLPSSWVEGSITLALDGSIDCSEAFATGSDCETQVYFEPGADVRITWIAARHKTAGGNSVAPPSVSPLIGSAQNLLPVSGSSLRTRSVPLDLSTRFGISDPPTSGEVKAWLLGRRSVQAIVSPSDLLWHEYLVLSGQNQWGFNFAVACFNTGAGWVAPGDGGNVTHVHEICHMEGLDHASQCSNPSTDGACVTSLPWVNGGDLGPSGDDNETVWGLDTRTYPPRVLDPSRYRELMSYCRPRWISKMSYEYLRGSSRAVTIEAIGAPTSPHYVVVGEIDLLTGAGTVQSVLYGDTSADLFHVEAGPYSLLALDGAGGVLHEVMFQPLTGEDADETGGVFAIPVPGEPEIAEFQVLLAQTLVDQVARSRTPPSVEVLFPIGGEVLSGEFSASWLGQDADSDPLVYDVIYSNDGGTTWTTLVTDWSDTSLSMSAQTLGGTNQGILRVVARDGFNTGSGLSGLFSIGDTPPAVDIISPAFGSEVSGEQAVFFEIMASDFEDGALPDSAIVWTSDIDGLLGTGHELLFEASELSAGQHVISVVVTDSALNDASDRVAIAVEGAFVPPKVELALDIEPGRCPNLVNEIRREYLEARLIGDVLEHVDVATLQLARSDGFGRLIAPRVANFESNQGSPADHQTLAGCLCDEPLLGHERISLLFKMHDVVEALELDDAALKSGVKVMLSGLYTNGAEFRSIDCLGFLGRGDTNADGRTDIFDFGILASHFGMTVSAGEDGDLDGNGVVDVLDFGILVSDFGAGTTPQVRSRRAHSRPVSEIDSIPGR